MQFYFKFSKNELIGASFCFKVKNYFLFNT